ncbi:hypothetical protein CHS0354_000037 [Potamilus streckersoni]|uniref:Uncharacterized protein n=1 Tax=Potamilus streckersoni TaxID=2493646 RepID=A0AAE0VJ96_9BIVA|nr:hypothetical protein CHS0354_000037 [Potamilus streckersoni]
MERVAIFLLQHGIIYIPRCTAFQYFTCKEPLNYSELILNEFLRFINDPTLNHIDYTFLTIDEVYKNSLLNKRRYKQYPDYWMWLSGNRQCSHHISNDIEMMHTTSTCPWYFELDYDPLRIPSNVVRARCSCKTCEQKGVCAEVMSYIPVVRKVCNISVSRPEEMEFEYHADVEELPVGCSCRLKVDV